MGLEIHRDRSKWWYSRIEVNGRKINRNLGVEIQGQIPPRLSQVGDIVFERSRAKAQAALERFQLDAKKRTTAEELIQTIHEIRTGSRVSSVPLTEIVKRWKDLPRRRPLSERYVDEAESRVKRFLDFVRKSNPSIHEMAQIRAPLARAFVKKIEERGVSAKTYNNVVIFLRSVFHTLRKEAGLAENPFDGIPTRDGEAIFRTPYKVDELELILQHAKNDPFIYPLIVTGMCTAMRRGDCCTLLRESVDLEGGFITVKTSKTGETIQIPIFPLLGETLKKALAKPSPRPPHFVFPELKAHYVINPDHLTDRVKRVLRAAGFSDELPSSGESSESRGVLQRQRKEGVRKASVRDFHSFRVTWVTLALSAGVPLEIVQKVTGHRTASIVMKHYFQPGRDEFRRTLASKMPALLVGGEAKPKTAPEALDPTSLRARLAGMSDENWPKIRDELLARLSVNGEVVVVDTEVIPM
ncbi:MAG TPA: site-specific integrase [Lacunisphaera sp.]|jgi:integrase